MSAVSQLQQARSWLFVPGHQPQRWPKARHSGADVVVLDLEDSVPLQDKAAARAHLQQQDAQHRQARVPLVVRINAPDSSDGEQDLAVLAGLSAVAGVMVPKSGSGEELARVHRRLPGLAVLPLIETVQGLDALDAIAASPGVLRLVVGHIDFLADTGMQCDDDETPLLPLRFAVAMATRRHRLAPAVDGVTVQLADAARLQRDTQRALRFGFGAKLCIHPRQVEGIHAALTPTPDEQAWAQRVLAADAAAAGAAVQVDGCMVDVPVVLRARQILARAGQHL